MPKTDSKEPSPLSPDLKRLAFTAAADAIGTLDKHSDQADVLRAVAAFYGFKVQFENGDIR